MALLCFWWFVSLYTWLSVRIANLVYFCFNYFTMISCSVVSQVNISCVCCVHMHVHPTATALWILQGVAVTGLSLQVSQMRKIRLNNVCLCCLPGSVAQWHVAFINETVWPKEEAMIQWWGQLSLSRKTKKNRQKSLANHRAPAKSKSFPSPSACHRRWFELHGGRPGVHQQGHLETGAVPHLRVRQRSGPLRWDPLRRADQLREGGCPRWRVLPHLPNGFVDRPQTGQLWWEKHDGHTECALICNGCYAN